MKALILSLFFIVSSQMALSSPQTVAPKEAQAYIISPKNHAVVSSPFTVRFGLKGMGVAPAGTQKKNTGHHHLIINEKLPDLNMPIKKDQHHVHFGGGQTEATVTLAKGKHTLFLLLGDHLHFPHKPAIKSETITITVK